MTCVKLASQAAFDLPLLFKHRQGDLKGPIPRNENHSNNEKQKGEQQKPESPIVVFMALICSGNAQGKEKPKGNCCTWAFALLWGSLNSANFDSQVRRTLVLTHSGGLSSSKRLQGLKTCFTAMCVLAHVATNQHPSCVSFPGRAQSLSAGIQSRPEFHLISTFSLTCLAI